MLQGKGTASSIYLDFMRQMVKGIVENPELADKNRRDTIIAELNSLGGAEKWVALLAVKLYDLSSTSFVNANPLKTQNYPVILANIKGGFNT